MCYVIKTNNIKLKSIPHYSWTYSDATALFIKWMTSQAYNSNDVL